VRHPIQDVVFAAVAHPEKAEEDSLAELRGLSLKFHFQAPSHRRHGEGDYRVVKYRTDMSAPGQ
jgi:hypothetical protein